MRAPTPDAGSFSAVDKSPHVSAGWEALDIQTKHRKDLQRDMDPLARTARQGARLWMGARHQKERQEKPNWSVSRAANAADDFLDELARYCLGGDPEWKAAAASAIHREIPKLVGPLRALESAREEMRTNGNFYRREDAEDLTRRALETATQISQLAEDRYRAVPGKPRMPRVAIRPTQAWRAKAIQNAIERCDERIECWHRFVFSSPQPSGRREQLDEISQHLRVVNEIAACEEQRMRCRTLADSKEASWGAARHAVRRLDEDHEAFERAVYDAVA